MLTKDADPKLIRLAQQVDQERTRRIAAERKAAAYKMTLARVLAAQRSKAEAERRSVG